jgi:hypothetical protein
MVRIMIQVRSGAARFSVAVQAESIERALEIAKKQNLGRTCKVTVPINSEAFFVAEPAAMSEPAGWGNDGTSRPVEISAHPNGAQENIPI